MAARDNDMAAQRATMVAMIVATTSEFASLTGRDAISPAVLDVIRALPRHEFVPPEAVADAYADRPVAIGCGQTISQPFIVALMSDLAEIKPGDRVLDVGTGSGYQAAVLSKLAGHVYTIEVSAPLAERAREAFARLGLGNITTRIGDGHRGWPEEAPFDAIVVAAAPGSIPDTLVEQLKPGGRLVIPVGNDRTQQLIVVQKDSDQSTILRDIIPVCFVPMIADAAAGRS